MKSLLSNEEKKQLVFRELSLSLLLHLEFTRLNNEKAFKVRETNELLSKQARKLLRLPHYKLLSRKLKSLLSSQSNVNLEALFLTAINFQSNPSDLEEYLLLIRSIEREMGLTVMLSSPTEVDLQHNGDKGFISVLSTDLNSNFSKSGKLYGSISFLAKLSKYKRFCLFNVIGMFERFSVSVNYEDEDFARFTLT